MMRHMPPGHIGGLFGLLYFLTLTPNLFAISPAPTLGAEAFLLMDYASGRILAKSNAAQRLAPGSLTKMMVAYICFSEIQMGTIKLDDRIRVSSHARKTIDPRMYLEVNADVMVQDLLKGVILQSANDASIVLAEKIAGSAENFVKKMTEMAKKLQMQDTHFQNSTGAPDQNHYASVQDLAILSRALIYSFPNMYNEFHEKQFVYNNIEQYNANSLLWRDPTVDGIHVAQIDLSSFASVSSAQRGAMRLIGIVYGAKTMAQRDQNSQVLLNYGFANFETHKLYMADQVLQEIRLWKGQVAKIRLGLHHDLYVTIDRGKHDLVNSQLRLKQPIIAPVKKGESLGQLSIVLGDKEIAHAEVFPMDDVAAAGWWRRTVDTFNLWFE